RLGVHRSRITVIPSGVDSTRFVSHGPAAPRTAGMPRLLSVGRLVPRKGFQDVIRALRWVPDAECVIVGGPPGRAVTADPFGRRLLQIAHEHGVAGRVHLVGAVTPAEMPTWY